jgi:hypothetical protein
MGMMLTRRLKRGSKRVYSRVVVLEDIVVELNGNIYAYIMVNLRKAFVKGLEYQNSALRHCAES